MNTYKYKFPVSGMVDDQPTFTASMLEEKLKNGYECLMAYCIFPSDSDILDHVSFDINGNEVTGLSLHTYSKLWEGMEDDLKECVQENLNAIAEEHDLDPSKILQITGDVELLELEGEIPKTLYHISEQENKDSILKNGLIPQLGKNAYKTDADYVYLMAKQDIVPWLTVLPNLNNPTILEVSTEGLKNIESGRHFTDRGFTMPDGYGEYRTKSKIPASNITEMELTEDVKKEFLETMKKQLHIAEGDEKKEVARGINRLSKMGIGSVEELLNCPVDDLLNDTDKEPGVSTKKLSTYLGDMRRAEQYKSLMDMPDRDLCETVRAHFESHPTMPGEKALKDKVNRALNEADKVCEGQEFVVQDKESIAKEYAKTRIRETSFEGLVIPNELKCEAVDKIVGKYKHDATPAETINIDKVDVELQRSGEQVHVVAEAATTGVTIIGELPEKFLKNNPMNVESCRAELQIVDYSNGKGKNISSRIVVDTDVMSGDVIDLDDDVINSLSEETNLEQ